MVRKRIARKNREKGTVSEKRVRFEFPSPEAKEVYLVGDFNHWDTHANKMKKDKNGIWRTILAAGQAIFLI